MSERIPRRGEDGVFDLERELEVAMREFTDRFGPRTYRVPEADRSRPILRRGPGRGRAGLIAVATAVLAGIAGTVAFELSGTSDTPRPTPSVFTTSTPAQPASPTPPPSTATKSSAAPTGAASPPAWDRGLQITRKLLLAAELSENPATRSRVDLTQVEALFTDHAAFVRAWGDGGLGVTCGQVADGVMLEGPDAMFRGATMLDQVPEVDLTLDQSAVTGVTCRPVAPGRVDPAAAYYGGLVAAGHLTDATSRRDKVRQLEQKYLVSKLRSTDGSAAPTTCHQNLPNAWVLDDPGAGTIVWSWRVTLDTGATFTIGYGTATDPTDPTGTLMTSVLCNGG